MVLILISIVVGLIFNPKPPKYAINNVSVKGINLTSLSTIFPEFDVSVKVDNGNKLGITYGKNNVVEIFYRDIQLSNSVLPAFYQPAHNVTMINMVVKGNNIGLAESDQKVLMGDIAKHNVLLTLKLNASMTLKVPIVGVTWKNKFMFECNVAVDELTEQAKIVHKNDCLMKEGFNLNNHFRSIWDD